jgi:hypothetical protein
MWGLALLGVSMPTNGRPCALCVAETGTRHEVTAHRAGGPSGRTFLFAEVDGFYAEEFGGLAKLFFDA